MTSTERPFGSWQSPLSAELCTAAQNGIGQISVTGGQVMIAESRASEGGRTVLLRLGPSGGREMTPGDFNVRTRLHEYGGLAYAAKGDTIVAVNDKDQRLHIVTPESSTPLTPPSDSQWRFAEPQFDDQRQRIIAVSEQHSETGQPVNRISWIDLRREAAPVTLVEGADFYAYPRLSPDGRHLAWIAWHHPQMPWDGTELWLAGLDRNGGISHARMIAGGPGESVLQPEWLDDGTLTYLSDRNGYWNLFHQDGSCLWAVDADCGGPLWQLGTRWYVPLGDRRFLCAFTRSGQWQLATIGSGEPRIHNLPFADISGVIVEDGVAYFRGASTNEPAVAVKFELATGEHSILHRAGVLPVAAEYISTPRNFEFVSSGRKTCAYYYPPTNASQYAADSEKPPLLVMCHGGPTSAASSALRLSRQFWTSRGFALCDVDYGGSTGYGREYRERLRGQWGIVDVEDCVAAAEHLAARGLADPDRLIIRGGSAGGFTVLAALTFHRTFRAGSSSYGIGDLELLAGDTHKFESRYLDSMIGPYPEYHDTYKERSPINHTENLRRR